MVRRGYGVAFDHAAMIADDLGDQRQAQAGAARLGGDEGIEDVGQQIGGTPEPLSRTVTSSGS